MPIGFAAYSVRSSTTAIGAAPCTRAGWAGDAAAGPQTSSVIAIPIRCEMVMASSDL